MAETVPLAQFAGLIPVGAFDALPARAWRASVLPGGRQVNLSLRLDGGQGGIAVLRVRRGPTLPGADFAREIACHRIAAAAGLAPAVRAASSEQGWILMDYVDSPSWTPARLENPDALVRMAHRLRQLHALGVPDFAPADGLALLRANCEVLAAKGADATGILHRGADLARQLAALPPRAPVLCHGDPDVGNLLGPEPLLIDFEYAQVADATYDLAMLLDYYPTLDAHLHVLQQAMGLDDETSRQRLALQRALCRVVNQAWELAQRAVLPQG